MNQEITFLTLFLLGFFWRNALRRYVWRLEQRFCFAAAAPFKPNRADCIVELGTHQQLCRHWPSGRLGRAGRHFLGRYARSSKRFVYCRQCLAAFARAVSCRYFDRRTKIEGIGKPIWKRLNPLLNKLLPIKSVPACFGVGVLWGWLPCGLVYSASLYALGSGNALHGGLYMLAFALGTLPNLLAMGIFAAQLKTFLQKRMVRLCAGLLVAGWAIWRLAVFAMGQIG